jgi:hypothetical protein
MPQIKGLKEIAYFDCAGGGQVYVQGNYAYIAHMDAPAGTTILDVSDPRRPKQVAHLTIPSGVHSHKVRVENDLMLVNWECPPPYKLGENFQGGLAIYDVRNPREPRQICFWKTAGTGVHRFDFDGRCAYITPEVEGYHLNIAMILDLKDPTRPEEVGRWWMPGQWVAGGETPDEGYRTPRTPCCPCRSSWPAARLRWSPTRTCASCAPRPRLSCGSSISPTKECPSPSPPTRSRV